MTDDKAYIRYGEGILTIDCVFKEEILLKGNMFKRLMNRLLTALNLERVSDAFKNKIYDNATITNFTNKSVGVDINDPKYDITRFVINSR
ncbi:hypothetical protein DY037_07055 [Apilactobacillus micheneri]|uniref:hypothetical protein n=1 Tax=Apilactobacillus micheneri TaxID=1899430 RepID=UPI00112B75B6|nr:hypothetical protein [Apilactobacillus micheneri]TPR48143.1 hypothetical protein DY037_07055 [Apilactobacillus micheneri]